MDGIENPQIRNLQDTKMVTLIGIQKDIFLDTNEGSHAGIKL
jgi:hypothetical protein